NGDTITRSTGSWLTEGFAIGETIKVTNAGANNGTYVLAAVNGNVLTVKTTGPVAAGPFNATFALAQDATLLQPGGDALPQTTDTDYLANITTGDVRVDVQVLDDESPGVFLLESGGKTLVTAGTTSSPPDPTKQEDTYTMRLTSAPTSDVKIDIVTD